MKAKDYSAATRIGNFAKHNLTPKKMATVRLTETLRLTIRSNIERLFRARMDACDDAVKRAAQTSALDIYHQLVPPELQNYLTQIPDSRGRTWFRKCPTIRVRLTDRTNPTSHWDVQIPLDASWPCPMDFESYHVMPIQAENLQTRDLWNALKAQYELQKSARETIDGVMRLADDCKTLKQLVDVWPTALNYVPADVVEKFHKKDERVKQETTKPQFDDQTRVNLIAATMLANGGINGT